MFWPIMPRGLSQPSYLIDTERFAQATLTIAGNFLRGKPRCGEARSLLAAPAFGFSKRNPCPFTSAVRDQKRTTFEGLIPSRDTRIFFHGTRLGGATYDKRCGEKL